MTVQTTDRIKAELVAAGVTPYGLMKAESKELPKIIHENEHIGGVVYGQIGGGSSAMLVATDQRIIFVDCKPLFKTIDELTYDVVSGIQSTKAGPFTSVVLYTRVNDYVTRYVNAKCANIFVKYIENRRLEGGKNAKPAGRIEQDPWVPVFNNSNDKEALAFLKEHELAVLSTTDRTGNVHGAIVYYVVDENNLIYILTKSGTGKGRNVYANGQVALTVHEEGTLQTLQIQGTADVETEQSVKDAVFSRIVKLRTYTGSGEQHLPPVTKLHEGAFMVIRIQPNLLSYHDYSKAE